MSKRDIKRYALAAFVAAAGVTLLLINGLNQSADALDVEIATPVEASSVASSPARPALPAVQYKLDSSQSRFMVRVNKDGLLSMLAHDHNIAIRDFDGTVQFSAGPISPASLHLTIEAASLAVTDKVSASDRQKIETTMRDEVLEVGKFSQIVFKSTKVDVEKADEGQFHAKIWGELTLHGVTKSGLINATVTMGQDQLRAKGSFPLRQSEYSIKPVSAAGGTIKVKDELRFTFDIVAHP